MNPLNDLIPARYRRKVYAALALAALAFTAYQAADGNWAKVVEGILVGLTGGMAHANTSDGE